MRFIRLGILKQGWSTYLIAQPSVFFFGISSLLGLPAALERPLAVVMTKEIQRVALEEDGYARPLAELFAEAFTQAMDDMERKILWGDERNPAADVYYGSNPIDDLEAEQ